jgi:hypothetical protein
MTGTDGDEIDAATPPTSKPVQVNPDDHLSTTRAGGDSGRGLDLRFVGGQGAQPVTVFSAVAAATSAGAAARTVSVKSPNES